MLGRKVTRVQAFGGLLLFLDGVDALSKAKLKELLIQVREHQEKGDHTDQNWDFLAETNTLIVKKIKEKG